MPFGYPVCCWSQSCLKILVPWAIVIKLILPAHWALFPTPVDYLMNCTPLSVLHLLGQILFTVFTEAFRACFTTTNKAWVSHDNFPLGIQAGPLSG